MEQINLNIIPDGAMPVCHASQFDKNRTIRFNLNQNGSVYTLAGTETITCKVRKPDDTENTINVANTSSSYVDVTFGLGDTDLSGYTMCELKIVKGTQTIGSRNFLLNIEADAFDGSKLEERSASGAIASFETNYIDNLNELIVNITATQAGSGTPSPSNPRAISGWSSCDVYVTGKNLFNLDKYLSDNNVSYTKDGEWFLFNLSNDLYNNKFDLLLDNYSVSFIVDTDRTTAVNPRLRLYKNSGVEGEINSNSSITKTIDQIGFNFSTAGTICCKVQAEFGLPTSYEPFGTTYPISLGDTYYGGTLNITTGELTVTHGYYTITGLEVWNITGDGKIIYADVLPNCKLVAGQLGQSTAMSNLFNNNPNAVEVRQAIYDNQININSQYIGGYSTEKGRIVINCSDFTSVSDAETFFQNNQTNIIYELATPTTVQLTPTEVRTLLNCNIFADTGDVVSCKYLVEVT